MVKLVRAAWMALFVAVSAVTASAQAIIDVPQNINSGNNITISFSDPTQAGKRVTVEIDDGTFPNPVVITVTIQLDGEGKGSAPWTVPQWECANFKAPGAREVSRAVH